MPMVTQPPAPLVGTESKQEQVLPVEAQRLYEAARALSTKCLELAAKELTAVPPSLDGIAVSLELSERLVRLAHSLDLLADKVTARGY
jgi:hypothetical protein